MLAGQLCPIETFFENVFMNIIADVFHWYCLNKYAQQLPSNTAPAGYTCPCCKAGIFPAQNVVSPVAEQLKEHLSKVNWARSGLGLPLVGIYNSYWNKIRR